MRILISYVVLFFTVQVAHSQAVGTKQNRQALVAEVLGNSRSIFSFNYERFFGIPKNERFFWSTRVGVGYNPGIKRINLKGTTSIPVVFTMLWGAGGTHYIEAKAGYTGSIGKDAIDSTVAPPARYLKYESACILSLGYRFMEYKGAMLEIIPMSLVWTNNPTARFKYSFGFSIGGAF